MLTSSTADSVISWLNGHLLSWARSGSEHGRGVTPASARLPLCLDILGKMVVVAEIRGQWKQTWHAACKAVPPSEGKWLRSCHHPRVFRETSEHSKEREPPVDDVSRGVTLGPRSQGRASHAGSQAVPVTESCTQAI